MQVQRGSFSRVVWRNVMSSLFSQASGFTCRLISRWLGDDSPAASSNWRREWKVNFSVHPVLCSQTQKHWTVSGKWVCACWRFSQGSLRRAHTHAPVLWCSSLHRALVLWDPSQQRNTRQTAQPQMLTGQHRGSTRPGRCPGTPVRKPHEIQLNLPFKLKKKVLVELSHVFTEGNLKNCNVWPYIDSRRIKGTFSTDGRPSVDGHVRVVAPQHQSLTVIGNGETNGQQEANTARCREHSIQEGADSESYLL